MRLLSFFLRVLTFTFLVFIPVCALSGVVGFTLGTLVAGVVLHLAR